LENEDLAIQELVDHQREEKISGGSRWIRRRVNAAGISPASKSQQGMEEVVSVLDRQTYQGVPEVVDCAVGIVIG
jgi:hypothetical protein